MESLKEVLSGLSERFKNPILTAFFVSWCVINFKVVLLLLSDLNYHQKLEEIAILYPSWPASAWQLAYWPAVSAAVYLFVVPIASIATTWSNGVFERWHAYIRAREAGKGFLTKDQRDELLAKIAKMTIEAQERENAARDSKDTAEAMTKKWSAALFDAAMPHLFYKLQRGAPNWPDTVRMPPARRISGTDAQNDLARDHGIPRQWVEIFSRMNDKVDAEQVCSWLGLTLNESLGVLNSLCALNMLKPLWIDGFLRFELVEDGGGMLWVSELNGRPA